MRAFQFVAWQTPPELRDVAVPEPGPGEVLVRVAASGACHSDLHIMDVPAGFMPFTLPFTLGHETAGYVEAVGAGVRSRRPGEAVAIYGPWGCGACRPCRRSSENYCEHASEIDGAGGGLGRDGGMAEYVLVPSERLLVPLGDLDPVDAAPLADAALTPYHAIARSRSALVPGTTAVVIGVGGLGHMAVQILRALTSARVIAVDSADAKLELARSLGADEAWNASDDVAARVKAATNGLGAELVVDFVGADTTLSIAASAVRSCGDVTIVGMALGTLPVNFTTVPYEASVQTTYWGSLLELTEVLALARAGALRAHVERFALDDAGVAYERLRDGSIAGRAVVVP
ncbi:MAG: NAD(P)-dependent alcohol dehydrogenase [Acidimicrobiia bacterium]